MKNKSLIVIVLLSIIVCAMAVGLSLFVTNNSVNSKNKDVSIWNVQIKDSSKTGYFCNVKSINKNKTVKAKIKRDSIAQATIDLEFFNVGDEVTCSIVYENNGTINAMASGMTITGIEDNDNIEFATSGIVNGTKLLSKKGKNINTLTIIGKYKKETSNKEDLNKKIIVSVPYIQSFAN